MQQKELIKIHKALGNSIRLSVMQELAKASSDGLTPSHLLDRIKTSFSTLSFHLNRLENAKLIYAHKKKLNMYYHINFATLAAFKKEQL